MVNLNGIVDSIETRTVCGHGWGRFKLTGLNIGDITD